MTADFTDTHISATINLSARIFSFGAIVKPVFSIKVQFSGTAKCELSDGFGLNIPGPAIPGLVVTVSPILSLSATGEIEVDAGPVFTAQASVGSSGAYVSVTSDIELEADLFAHVFDLVDFNVTLYDGQYFRSTMFDKCTPGTAGSPGSGSESPPQSSGGGSGGPAGSGEPYLGPTVQETTGSTAQTWTDYVHAGGTQGPGLSANQTVGIACRTVGFRVADGNTWWYQIASGPWNDAYYASADAFYNNGQTSSSLNGTPFVDGDVPDCSGPTPPPPPASTFAETTGSVTHTWTDHSDAGGTEGPTIASNQTVQITCRVQGSKVADGNTWWYQIASSPWSNAYYGSADAFYNNGATSGSLNGTPYVDPDVPLC